jgi:oligopeptide transport system substrate-binding protein
MRPGKKFTHGLLPTLLCLIAMLVVACGGSQPTAGPTGVTKASADKQINIFPNVGVADIATFDPGLSTDFNSITAIDMVFTGLVQLDDKLQVHPQLAQSWQEMPDGLTWKFTLKSNLKFSDGTPLTSQDVVYSINRALTPGLKSITAPIYLALVKDSDKMGAGKIKTLIGDSLLAPDPNTVTIVTNKKASYFLDTLTYSCSYIVEKSLVEKYGNTGFTDHLTEGGGAGPFKVAEYTHNKRIVFVPNPNYYGPKPQLAKVVMPFYKETETAYKAYQVGQVDSLGTVSVPSNHIAEAKKLTREFHTTPQLSIFYYAMNYLVKPFDNISIRQAFALALNKEVIAHAVYKDTVMPTNHIVPQGMPGYNPNLTGPGGVKSPAGDQTKAKALFQTGLQEEGLTPATLPPITLTYPSGSADIRKEVAAAQQMWQSTLGVSVKLSEVSFNNLLTAIPAASNNPKGLQFWWIGWIADYPDAQDWTTLQFDKGVPNNNANYGQNKTSDAAQQQATQQLLEQADVNPDQNARLQQYMTAEQQLVNDVAWLPSYQGVGQVLRKPCLVGVVDNPSGLTPPDDWGAVYISTDTPCADTSSVQ